MSPPNRYSFPVGPVIAIAIACMFTVSPVIAEEKPSSHELQAATRMQILVMTKSFCVTMRRNGSGTNLPSLRESFDPDYIRKYELEEGEFRLEMLPVRSIHDIQIADDRSTVLCHVTTDDADAVVIFRVVLCDGRPYFSPVRPPADPSRMITPWILHKRLD
ncbi:MAG: hypothetical protein HKN47_19380 [Pirellulaceae bacterium]|nr:hypothetical protein [Pirellulaceae bacterium]